MRSCLVFILASATLAGCGTPHKAKPILISGEVVRPVVMPINEAYSEEGGAAKYSNDNQHLLVLRPATHGEYVKLEPKAPKGSGFVEFKVPPPKVTVTESTSRSMIVFFKFNSSKLGKDAKNTLKQIAEASPDVVKVSVQGFADNIGKPKSNLPLSKQRSEMVVKALVEAGISEEKIQSDGLGSESPIDDNKTLDGRARNRRVEITILGEEHVVSASGSTANKTQKK